MERTNPERFLDLNEKRSGNPRKYRGTHALFLTAVKERRAAIVRGDWIRTKPAHPDRVPSRSSSAKGKGTSKAWIPLADGSPDVEEKKVVTKPNASPPLLPPEKSIGKG